MIERPDLGREELHPGRDPGSERGGIGVDHGVGEAADADAAVELLARHHPGTALIGQATTAAGVVELPKQGLVGRRGEGFAPAG